MDGAVAPCMFDDGMVHPIHSTRCEPNVCISVCCFVKYWCVSVDLMKRVFLCGVRCGAGGVCIYAVVWRMTPESSYLRHIQQLCMVEPTSLNDCALQ